MKKILFVIFTILCMGNIVAQTSDRDVLTEQLIQRAILENKQLDLNKSSKLLVTKLDWEVDTLVAEATLYQIIYDLIEPEFKELYAPLSDKDLSDYANFLNSDINKKLDGEEMISTFRLLAGMDMMAYMLALATEQPYESSIKNINDAEYNALANKYLDALNVSSAMEELMALFGDDTTKDMDPKEKEMTEKTMKYFGNMFPLYFKNALYKTITKEELTVVVEIYQRPTISEVNKNMPNVMKRFLEKFSTQQKELFKEKVQTLTKAMSDPNDTTGAKEKYIEYLKKTGRPIPVATETTTNENDNNEVYLVVDQMPEFPGGMGALMKYFSDNVRYPVYAAEKKIQGRVICQFVVNKDGSISDIKVIKGVDKSLDREAVRLIENMPYWKPGVLNEEKVRCKYTVPVSFRLQ